MYLTTLQHKKPRLQLRNFHNQTDNIGLESLCEKIVNIGCENEIGPKFCVSFEMLELLLFATSQQCKADSTGTKAGFG